MVHTIEKLAVDRWKLHKQSSHDLTIVRGGSLHPENQFIGIFAKRTEYRPNPICMTTYKLLD